MSEEKDVAESAPAEDLSEKLETLDLVCLAHLVNLPASRSPGLIWHCPLRAPLLVAP